MSKGLRWTVRHQGTVMPTSPIPALGRSNDAIRCRQSWRGEDRSGVLG